MANRIAIVGFGVAGRVAALLLARHYQLTVFEQHDAMAQNSAGFVAAAMLAPLAESTVCESDLAEQGLRALALWPKILQLLDEPVFFQQAGTLVVAHPQDGGAMAQFKAHLKPLRQHTSQTLNAHQVKELEPELAGRFQSGLYLPCEGQLDNMAFYRHSYAQLCAQGVQFQWGVCANVHALAEQDFDYVIDCRGLGAKTDEPTLRGVRGEVARVYAPEVTLNRPVRLMHPRYPIYVAPKEHHEFVIGATEIESNSNAPVSVQSTLELLSAAYSLHSGFAQGEVKALQTGLRPAFKDNRPKISQTHNIISINGLYRHGYLLAPVVVAKALSGFRCAI